MLSRLQALFDQVGIGHRIPGGVFGYIVIRSEMGHFGKLLSMCGGEDSSQRSGICSQFFQLKIRKIAESVLPWILGVPGL